MLTSFMTHQTPRQRYGTAGNRTFRPSGGVGAFRLTAISFGIPCQVKKRGKAHGPKQRVSCSLLVSKGVTRCEDQGSSCGGSAGHLYPGVPVINAEQSTPGWWRLACGRRRRPTVTGCIHHLLPNRRPRPHRRRLLNHPRSRNRRPRCRRRRPRRRCRLDFPDHRHARPLCHRHSCLLRRLTPQARMRWKVSMAGHHPLAQHEV